MGLFDKKSCDVCGGKIGLLGNRKLEDGNMCKDCASLLSPFTTDRRRTTLAEIKEHLAYREANKANVAAFNVTRTLGEKTKVLLDEDAGKFMVTSSSRWQNENPDVMAFSQVTGCNVEIREDKIELKADDNNQESPEDRAVQVVKSPDKRDDKAFQTPKPQPATVNKTDPKLKVQETRDAGNSPPQYRFEYDFYITIHINSPWFSEIKFQLNRGSIEDRGSVAYQECENLGNEIKAVLTQIRQETRETVAAAAAPKAAQTCPRCGASTVPDARGCCEYCGSAMQG